MADLGYRGIHEATDKAHAIIQAFYGDRTRGAYLSDFVVSRAVAAACSNGKVMAVEAAGGLFQPGTPKPLFQASGVLPEWNVKAGGK